MEVIIDKIIDPSMRFVWCFVFGEFFRLWSYKGLKLSKRLKNNKKKSEWISETIGYFMNILAALLIFFFLDKNIELFFQNIVISMSLHLGSVRGIWQLIEFVSEYRSKKAGNNE